MPAVSAHEKRSVAPSVQHQQRLVSAAYVIAKHIEVEPDDVHITLERGEEISLLEIDVELPIKALDEDQ